MQTMIHIALRADFGQLKLPHGSNIPSAHPCYFSPSCVKPHRGSLRIQDREEGSTVHTETGIPHRYTGTHGWSSRPGGNSAESFTPDQCRLPPSSGCLARGVVRYGCGLVTNQLPEAVFLVPDNEVDRLDVSILPLYPHFEVE